MPAAEPGAVRPDTGLQRAHLAAPPAAERPQAPGMDLADGTDASLVWRRAGEVRPAGVDRQANAQPGPGPLWRQPALVEHLDRSTPPGVQARPADLNHEDGQPATELPRAQRSSPAWDQQPGKIAAVRPPAGQASGTLFDRPQPVDAEASFADLQRTAEPMLPLAQPSERPATRGRAAEWAGGGAAQPMVHLVLPPSPAVSPDRREAGPANAAAGITAGVQISQTPAAAGVPALQRQEESDEWVSPMRAPGAESAASEAPGREPDEPVRAAKVDLDELARQLCPQIKRMLAVDRERRTGRWG